MEVVTMAKKMSGVLGLWSDESKVLVAARKVREAGFKKFDAITPYPVHGMEEAVGIKRSGIPWVTFGAGLLGGVLGLYFQYWVASVDWPINIGGKPFFSLPAFIPVTFETTVLFAALFSVAAMILVNGLPAVNPKILDPDLTSHKFAILIPNNDVGYSQGKVEDLLKELGADEVRLFYDY